MRYAIVAIASFGVACVSAINSDWETARFFCVVFLLSLVFSDLSSKIGYLAGRISGDY